MAEYDEITQPQESGQHLLSNAEQISKTNFEADHVRIKRYSDQLPQSLSVCFHHHVRMSEKTRRIATAGEEDNLEIEHVDEGKDRREEC